MRRTRALAAVAALLAGFAVLGVPAPASARRSAPVTLSVVNVSPNTPTISSKPQPLVFTLEITNHTADPIDSVKISASRSDPIGSQQQLDRVLANPQPPSPDQVSPISATAQSGSIAGYQTGRVKLRTTTSVLAGHGGVCLCVTAVYPIWFVADYTAADNSGGSATAQTYVPSFTNNPAKSTVSWVWPLLDRPHRLLRSRVFFDDALAGEVGPNGRLYRLLQVAQQVSPSVPMTIVTDPDLIDELAQMAQGYKVAAPHGVKPGTGSAAATAWLATLRDVLDRNHAVKLVFTPFADPAVDSLTRAGMTWSVSLDPRARALVTQALGGLTPLTDLAWPVGRSFTPATLRALVLQGANTVIASDHSLVGDVGPSVDALADINTHAGQATLAVTSAPLQRLVGDVLDPTRNGLALLPKLVAQLAIRIVDRSEGGHFVVLAPPRRLDVDVATAVQTIEATANTTWSRPATIEKALAHVKPAAQVTIRPGVEPPQLPPRLLRILSRVSNAMPQLTSLFHDTSRANALATPFPAAIQRCESTSLIGDNATSFAMAGHLQHVLRATQQAVYLVRPSDGTYTLTSKNSYLPITVVNKLNAEVDVRITVTTVSGVPGLATPANDRIYSIKALSRVQVKIPTHVDRVGLIGVVVRIQTPSGLLLGAPIHLSVRSTALGTIGVIITVLAAIVLAAAVVIRAVRRVRSRRAPDSPEPEPARVRATTGR